MTDLIEKLEKAHFVATDAQVESLALERYSNAAHAVRADGTYLRVLVVATQSQVGTRRRGRLDAAAQTNVLEAVHEKFYAAVLRGVTTPEVAPDDALAQSDRTLRSLERNRRSAFARSAKSTLSAYVRAGGDLRALVASQVTKAALRAAIAPPEPPDKVTRQIARSEGALLRALKRQAKVDPVAAERDIERCIEELQNVLDSLDTGGDAAAATTVVGVTARTPQRTRVGVPMLNRGA